MSSVRQGGTRREHLKRMKNRPKPKPVWMEHGWRIAGLVGLAAAVLGVPTYLIMSGWVEKKTNAIETAWYNYTADAGLALSDIFVMGREQAAPADILLALGIEKGDPLLGFDVERAKQQIESLPWIETARVERRFPNTLMVSLNERSPVGFLQQNGMLTLVDNRGLVLATDGLSRWSSLPILIGEQAPQKAPVLLEILTRYGEVKEQIKALTYVNQRRWDMHLKSGIIINLPETDPASALDRLVRANDDNHILSKDLSVIDLRLPDRMILTPKTPLLSPTTTRPR